MRVLITGASRGIGAAVARVFAAHHGADARVALLARSMTTPSHASLEGTLAKTALDLRDMGAAAFPYEVDMRHGEELVSTVSKAIGRLGGLDVLINNASALHLGEHATVRQMNLLHQVNTRGTMICNETCLPYLEESRGSIVTLSPPIRLGRLDWISSHAPYTISKYGMTLATLARADRRVRANCLWPRRCVATEATRRLEREMGVEGAYSRGRDPHEVAQAVYTVATSRRWNAECLLDEDVYDMPPTNAPLDLFVEDRMDTYADP